MSLSIGFLRNGYFMFLGTIECKVGEDNLTTFWRMFVLAEHVYRKYCVQKGFLLLVGDIFYICVSGSLSMTSEEEEERKRYDLMLFVASSVLILKWFCVQAIQQAWGGW